jgi:hypothetical protein
MGSLNHPNRILHHLKTNETPESVGYEGNYSGWTSETPTKQVKTKISNNTVGIAAVSIREENVEAGELSKDNKITYSAAL